MPETAEVHCPSSIFHSQTTMNFMKKAAILAIAALGANAWDAAEKEAALKVVDECARGVQWWIFQSVDDRIADERRRLTSASESSSESSPSESSKPAPNVSTRA